MPFFYSSEVVNLPLESFLRQMWPGAASHPFHRRYKLRTRGSCVWLVARGSWLKTVCLSKKEAWKQCGGSTVGGGCDVDGWQPSQNKQQYLHRASFGWLLLHKSPYQWVFASFHILVVSLMYFVYRFKTPTSHIMHEGRKHPPLFEWAAQNRL